MWATIVAKLLGSVSGVPEGVIDYYKEKNKLKQELKKAKIQGKIDVAKAKAERAAKEQTHVHTWETMYLKMQELSSKDEIVLAVFLWPIVGVFIPVVQDYVVIGFDYLERIPLWWVGITVTLSLAIYGIRHRNAARIAAPGLRDSEVIAKTDDPADNSA